MAVNKKVVNLFGDRNGGGDSGGPSNGDDDWRSRILRTKDGAAKASPHNLQLILQNHEDLADLFKLDEFANRIMVCGEPPWAKSPPPGKQDMEFTEVDGFRLAAWLGQGETFSMGVRPDQVMTAVEAIAHANKFHPVKEYLDRQEWDSVERIPTMFSDFFGTHQDEYMSAVALIFMISAVARIYKPGCKVDTMIVLEGVQGAGKSTSLIALFSELWHSDAIESPNSKDFYQSLLGNWVIEIGELSSFSKAEVHKVKQMLSAPFDTYRPSYGRYARKFPRQSVFVGTTNEDDWNRDYTGARRFLPVRCKDIDVSAIRNIRDQLWAEAVHRYKAGEQWGKLPEAATIEQDARYQEDSWQELITRWTEGFHMGGADGEEQYPDLIGMLEQHPEDAARRIVMFCSTTDVLKFALKLDVGKHGRPEQMRVGQILRRMGWHKGRDIKRGRRQEYIRPQLPTQPIAPPAAGAGEVPP